MYLFNLNFQFLHALKSSVLYSKAGGKLCHSYLLHIYTLVTILRMSIEKCNIMVIANSTNIWPAFLGSSNCLLSQVYIKLHWQILVSYWVTDILTTFCIISCGLPTYTKIQKWFWPTHEVIQAALFPDWLTENSTTIICP